MFTFYTTYTRKIYHIYTSKNAHAIGLIPLIPHKIHIFTYYFFLFIFISIFKNLIGFLCGISGISGISKKLVFSIRVQKKEVEKKKWKKRKCALMQGVNVVRGGKVKNSLLVQNVETVKYLRMTINCSIAENLR